MLTHVLFVPPHTGGRLTALVVDDALLRLLGVELAQRAVLWILLDVSLPGPHPHPAGHAAGGPADPLGHHARRRLCRRGDAQNKKRRYVTSGCRLEVFLPHAA